MAVATNPIFCAIDTPSLDAAVKLAIEVKDHVGGLKLGLEFFSANGPDGVKEITKLGSPIFLDVKLHDIPTTVAGAVRSLTRLAPAFLTVHAGGGRAMLEAAAAAARDASDSLGVPRPRLLGVTVMTSLDESDLHDVGQDASPGNQVDRLSFLAVDSGLDGVICSSMEIDHLRRRYGSRCVLMVPGIRPDWTGADDQKRVMEPKDAIRLGADYLVIGRPITRATDPAAAARRIAAEILAV